MEFGKGQDKLNHDQDHTSGGWPGYLGAWKRSGQPGRLEREMDQRRLPCDEGSCYGRGAVRSGSSTCAAGRGMDSWRRAGTWAGVRPGARGVHNLRGMESWTDGCARDGTLGSHYPCGWQRRQTWTDAQTDLREDWYPCRKGQNGQTNMRGLGCSDHLLPLTPPPPILDLVFAVPLAPTLSPYLPAVEEEWSFK
ncbi:hypothetical protein Bca52824_023514 [Brassica carinata]|uniref:Uncharacterized protein n=1 Tax=Brassica carinata TaxID=52824 RepID=A0A8X7VIP0_BRACI|nr:hypothetical protein Bca52824_023514 [Brassica carinata]